MRAWSEDVSQAMIAAVSPQPGERVLELAAGVGETGMLAAELVGPIGTVVISDQAQGMLEGARARAAELGLDNVEFQVLNAEWIDLPLASVDIVLCRYGYMLMADPAAALSETRRVLRPGGPRGAGCVGCDRGQPVGGSSGGCAARAGASPHSATARVPGRSRSAASRDCGTCSSRRASPRSRSCRWRCCAATPASRTSGS